MQSGDENVDEESQSLMQVEGFGDDEIDIASKSSKKSSGAAGDKITPTAEENTSPELGITQIPLEEMLKGLIISQIRAPYVLVEEGLINLLKECIIAEQNLVISASLSGHVDHFQSVDEEDLGWGCGWRNIQILCSFLLAEDPESREVLFNGAGFVPDIPALQIWLEIAWAKGFDKPGAEYFNWAISGTRKWIGTTECAALLRSFGVRAKIVSFTALGGKRVRGGLDKQKAGKPPIMSSDDEQVNETDDEPVKDSEDEHLKDSVEILTEGMKNCPGQDGASDSRGGDINSGNVNKESELRDNCVKAASQNGPPQKGGSQLSRSGGGSSGSQWKERLTGAAQNSGSGGSSIDFRGIPEDAEDLEDTEPCDMSQNYMQLPADIEPSGTDHHWNFVCEGCRTPIKEKRYKSLSMRNFDLCSSCMTKAEENPTEERSSHHNYIIIEEHPAPRNSGPPEEDQEREDDSDSMGEVQVGIDQEEKSEDVKDDFSMGKVDSEVVKGKLRERGGMSVDDNDLGSELDQMTKSLEAATGPKTDQPENPVGPMPLEIEERGKAGMQGTSSGGSRDGSTVNHHHLIEWVWSYFTQGAAQSSTGTTQTSREVVHMSKRSPLYFQHRGHSRTIVGIERRREPTGSSEGVYLLVLDPSVNQKLLPGKRSVLNRLGGMEGTKFLVKSLREKSGWQRLIEYDVHTLIESEYQLCYVDPGIAVGEELERLKILSSLRLTFNGGILFIPNNCYSFCGPECSREGFCRQVLLHCS